MRALLGFVFIGWSVSLIVRTKCGELKGRQLEDGVGAWQGIRYGVQRRFERSSVAGCWEGGTLDATELGPACYQGTPLPPQGVSEDCLNLNIYRPLNVTHAGGGLLPVLFYVYGGGNVAGDNWQSGAGPILASSLQALVVIPNYRLGGLGYLVDLKSNLTGNYGISDILTALRWARPLLESFGGDASRIVMMGQSSGGTNVLALLAAPEAKGLFQGAISLSASPNITQDVATASQMQATSLLPLIGCKAGDRACLMEASPENITAACDALQGGEGPPSFNPPNFPWSPRGNQRMGLVIVDGSIVVQPLLKALRIPIVDVAMLIQSVQCEMDPSDVSVDRLANGTQFRAWLSSYLLQHGWTGANSSTISHTVASIYEKRLGPVDVEWGLESWLADLGVTCGNDEIARIASTSFKWPVFRSHLVAPPSHPFSGAHFAFHSWDFPVLGVGFYGDKWSPQGADLQLAHRIRSSWGSMLHDGSANGFLRGGCTQIRWLGALGPCGNGAFRCKSLHALGFGPAFWWVN